MTDWSEPDLVRIDRAEELRIAAKRTDGSLHRSVPVWVVRVGTEVYVRTWHRRDTGWFGRVLRSERAHVEVPGVARDVTVEDVGVGDPSLRSRVDAAYAAKYGRYGDATVGRMVADDAAAATLRLVPGPTA